MGVFQRHEPCPNCGSRDNLGVWSDGSWCFGCGHRIPNYKSMSIEDIKKQISYDDNKEKKNRRVYLPDDFTTDLPETALAWLKQYEITDDELVRFRIGWTETEPALPRSLVFPAFDVWGNLLLCQFRHLQPKLYYTRGHPESILWTVRGGRSLDNTLCVVEDFVSAIRVGRQCESSPLWGANLSLNQIKRISDRYENLILWLDYDKTGEAAKLRVKAQPFFKSVRQIVTQEDPKAYADREIEESLRGV